jgi:hypothetical protein
MTPTTEPYTDKMDQDSDIESFYPWMGTMCEADFLYTATKFPLWKMKSVKYGIPNGVVKTIAMLEWLETQGGVYSLLLNGSFVLPRHIFQELKRSVFWSYMLLSFTSGLQIRVKPHHMLKFGLHFNGTTYYMVNGCLDVYSRAYDECMKLLKIAQRRFV